MKKQVPGTKHRIYTMVFARIYPMYIAKAEKKGRTKAEVDDVIRWLTDYTQKGLESQMKKEKTLEAFFADAPKLNPLRKLITGVICGVRIEDIEDPIMREVRYLDKLIDELAKGRAMEKILRKQKAFRTLDLGIQRSEDGPTRGTNTSYHFSTKKRSQHESFMYWV